MRPYAGWTPASTDKFRAKGLIRIFASRKLPLMAHTAISILSDNA